MVVPENGPCGIGDYARRLETAMSGAIRVIHDPLFNARDFDILHVQYEPALFRHGRKSRFPALMRKNSRIKRVVTVHEAYEKNPFIAPRPCQKGLLGFLKKLRYDYRHDLEIFEASFPRRDFFADAVIVHTRDAKAILTRQGCHAERMFTLPHPVFDHAPALNAPPGWKNPPEDKKTLLWFGFISPAVDFDTLFGALKILKDRCYLVLAGSTRRPEDKAMVPDLEKRVQAEGLSGHVQWTGYVAEECLSFLFSRADVFVSTPRFKTASGSLSHALGEGLPIAAPDLPYVREINAEGNGIKTYAPGDPCDLARQITALLDAGTHQEYGRRLRRYAARHTLTNFAEDHAAIYGRLLESSH
jgi:glycosyltransferase involved in cell wall biosynthesis